MIVPQVEVEHYVDVSAHRDQVYMCKNIHMGVPLVSP